MRGLSCKNLPGYFYNSWPLLANSHRKFSNLYSDDHHGRIQTEDHEIHHEILVLRTRFLRGFSFLNLNHCTLAVTIFDRFLKFVRKLVLNKSLEKFFGKKYPTIFTPICPICGGGPTQSLGHRVAISTFGKQFPLSPLVRWVTFVNLFMLLICIV